MKRLSEEDLERLKEIKEANEDSRQAIAEEGEEGDFESMLDDCEWLVEKIEEALKDD